MKRHRFYDELVCDHIDDKEFFKGVYEDKWNVDNKDLATHTHEQDLLKEAVSKVKAEQRKKNPHLIKSSRPKTQLLQN